MSMPVHWHEGLFLQPHHLQALQRTAFHHIWGGARLHSTFPYGVVSAHLSADELAEGRIRFDPLHVVMPSGTVFRFPEDAELPSMDVKNAFQRYPEGFTVGLALPLLKSARANTIRMGDATTGPAPNLRYRAHEELLPDENDGTNKQPVQMLRLNGRMAFDKDLLDDMEFLPLVKVIPQPTEDSKCPRKADPTFVPATLLLSGSPVLFKLVRDLAAAVSGVRNQLGDQLANNPLDLRALQGAQFEQLNRLRCLARGASLLNSIVDDVNTRAGCAGRMPTFEVYLALQDLLAELSSLYPAKRVFSWLPYDHDNPYPPFEDLNAKIRAFLNPYGINCRKFNFILERGLFYGDVPNGFFKEITDLYLSIECEQDPTSLARMVEDRHHFKLLPASYVEQLAVFGLVLSEERSVPPELPLRTGQYYYRVDTAASSPVVWERFQIEPRAAVHFQAPNLSVYQLSLYATLPPKA